MADLQKSMLPTCEELAMLPRWARVAFAARCARRMLPLLQHFMPNSKELLRIGESTVLAAEAGVDSPGMAHLTDVLADAAKRLARDCFALDSQGFAAANALDSARFAALAASDPMLGYDSDAMACATQAIHRAEMGETSYAWESSLHHAMKHDFDLLTEAARQNGWTDETPIPPPAFFGPIWPEGPPKGWPPEFAQTGPVNWKQVRKEIKATLAFGDPPFVESGVGSKNCELLLTIDVPCSLSNGQIKKLVRELSDHADELHRAQGGKGLQVVELTIEEDAHVREGVPA